MKDKTLKIVLVIAFLLPILIFIVTLFLPYPCEYYEIDSRNPYFASYKGALYTKNYKKLLSYPKNKGTIEIHPNTEVITKNAFKDYSMNTTIVIPWGTLEIEDEAFGYTDESITFVIPDTVTKVGKPSQEREVSPGNWIYPTWIPSRNNQVAWDEWVMKQPPKGPGDRKGPNEAPYDNIASYYGIKPNSFKTFENGKTYYFDSNYKMVTGLKEIDGKQYYFDENGALTE